MQITAIAVFIKNGKVLLEKRSPKEDNYAGFWALPGGHKKKSEKIKKTLAREMKEELNVDLSDYVFIGKFRDKDPTSKKNYMHNAFLCRKWKGAVRKTKEEEQLKWFRIADVLGKDKKFRRVDKRILKKFKKSKP